MTTPSNFNYPCEKLWVESIPEDYRKITMDACLDLPLGLTELALKCVNHDPVVSLYLFGEWGSGKTTLAFALIRHLMHKFQGHGYFWPNYVTGKEFDSRLLKANKSYEGDGYEIEKFIESDLLFIDDIDKISPTERFKNQFFEIINNRFIKKKPTIITSNLTPNELSELIDGSIASRMCDQTKWMKIGFPKKDFRKTNIMQF